MDRTIFLPNGNSVELVGVYGGDKTHALSAWTSTERELTPEREARIDKMLRMLFTNEHHTPFEKSMIHFVVETDIATHIHLLKHRIGVSINAESARYKELLGSVDGDQDRIMIPSDWPIDAQELLRAHTTAGFHLYHMMINKLTPTLGRKRAKESARYFLGYASKIKSDVSFNFRSFAHFQRLRNAPDAQVEVRTLAGAMLDLLRTRDEFRVSMDLLEEGLRRDADDEAGALTMAT